MIIIKISDNRFRRATKEQLINLLFPTTTSEAKPEIPPEFNDLDASLKYKLEDIMRAMPEAVSEESKEKLQYW